MKIKILMYYYLLVDFFNKKKVFTPKIKSIEDTIEDILKNNKSISRFGEGEFDIIFGGGNGFQDSNKKLKEKLKIVLNSNSKGFLVCLPESLITLKNNNKKSKEFWIPILAKSRLKWISLLNKKQEYGNAFVTRPYMMYEDRSSSKDIFNKFKLVWKQKDILIIEGIGCHLGLDNDLFSECNSIERILCPSKNAINKYDEILKAVNEVDKNKLILLALGQTATALSYDLFKEGFQSIDLGHLDVEYEWFLAKSIEKIKIKNKNTNEVGNYRQKKIDKRIENQIIKKII